MKREGTFCDLTALGFDPKKTSGEPCPHLAVGRCIGCGKDVCDKHGSATALSVSIQRQPKDTSSHVEMTRGSIAMCWKCSMTLDNHKQALVDNIVPGLADVITEGIAALLAADTMKETKS